MVENNNGPFIGKKTEEEIVMNPGNLYVDNTNHQVLQIRHRENQQVEIQDAGTVKHVVLNKSDFQKHAQSKTATEHVDVDPKLIYTEMGIREKIFTSCCLVFCCCCFTKLKKKTIVNEGNRAILFRYGRINKAGAAGAGRYTLYQNVDEIRVVNIQDGHMKFTIPEMFTIEQISVTLNCVLLYQVVDPVKVILNIVDWESSIRLMAASIIRDKVGTHTLADVLQNRESYQESILKELVEVTIMWGVRVLRVELKDFNVIRNVLLEVQTNKPVIKQQAQINVSINNNNNQTNKPVINQQPQINMSINNNNNQTIN